MKLLWLAPDINVHMDYKLPEISINIGYKNVI